MAIIQNMIPTIITNVSDVTYRKEWFNFYIDDHHKVPSTNINVKGILNGNVIQIGTNPKIHHRILRPTRTKVQKVNVTKKVWSKVYKNIHNLNWDLLNGVQDTVAVKIIVKEFPEVGTNFLVYITIYQNLNIGTNGTTDIKDKAKIQIINLILGSSSHNYELLIQKICRY